MLFAMIHVTLFLWLSDRATSELNAKEDISLMREVCERAKQSTNA